MTITEALRDGKIGSLRDLESRRARVSRKVVSVGHATAVIPSGRTVLVHLRLTGTGSRLLRQSRDHQIKVRLTVTQTIGARHKVITRHTLTFTTRRR
jgi:hypothetical protein